MARLSSISSLVARLPPQIRTSADKEGHRPDAWRRWYSLKRWKLLRWRVFVRDRFTCQRPECGRIEPDTSMLVADHKIPHRGDPELFWDEDNVHTLCKSCHDTAKQREERAWQGRGGSNP